MKREAVKYIRDKAKKGYEKSNECRICMAKEELDFHHYKSISRMLEAWLKTHKQFVETDVVEFREEFISDNHSDMYHNTVTLCKKHHKQLHKIYGVEPLLVTAEKQKRWVEIQRGKHELIQ